MRGGSARARVVALAWLFALAFIPCTVHAQAAGDTPARAAHRVTKMPRLLKFVEATYPPEKKAAGISASVILTLDLSARGDVTRAVVATSAGEDFDAAALEAARKLEFEPAEVDGKPAPSRITYRYAFVLKEEPLPASGGDQPSPEAGEARGASDANRTRGATDANEAPPGGATPAPTAPVVPPPPVPQGPTSEVTVRAARRTKDAVSTRISAREGRHVAGTQGDVLKVVQNLPGVARPPLASGQIVVWGSAPEDTRVFVDGVEIPALYHGSALRSTVNSDLVASIELVPGAYGAEYGRGLGGLVRVETRPLPQDPVRGYVAADTLDASAMMSARLTERTRVAVTARQSYLDRLVAATSAPDVADVFPIPRYKDGQIKATYDLDRGESVDAVFLLSDDALTRTVGSADPARVRSQDQVSAFQRAYLHYTRRHEGEATDVTPFVGHDHARTTSAFGGTPTSLEADSLRYGVRASHKSRVARPLDVTIGVDAAATSTDLTRRGTLTLPAREGDIAVFGQAPATDFAADDWNAGYVDVAPFVTADVRLGPVTVTPGVRLDAMLLEASRKTPKVGLTPPVGRTDMNAGIDPRLAVRWQVAPRLAAFAAGGIYHQPPDPADMSAVFGTPALGVSRATHASLGEALRITDTLTLETTAFYKSLQDLEARSRLGAPVLARALVQDGEGRSYGVQLLLRQELASGFFGWISYTESRSQRRYVGDATWRLFDYDQPHVLAVVLSKELGRWVFGARFRYASGSPRTPVTGASYDARLDTYQPTFGAANSIRLPDFYQLDLRVERSFPLGRKTALSVYVDALNVTFHQNREEIVYSEDFKTRGYINGLPTLAVVGARLDF